MYKPMLAEDIDWSKSVYPLGKQPKIDGVRGVSLRQALTGRSMKPFGNRYITQLFSHPAFFGIDGEFAAEDERHTDLCRLTSSATSTHEGEPWLLWHAFDWVIPETRFLTYMDRYVLLANYIRYVQQVNPILGQHLKLVPMYLIENQEQDKAMHDYFMGLGYEGSINRKLDGAYKEGRSTVIEGGLIRIKDFIEEDAIVLRVIEGEVNNNEKTINPLGRSERSSHQANKVPNGMVGSFECWDIKTQKEITVGAGTLDHKTRKLYWEHPELIVGETIKYKTFPKGVKDKPRFPTFASVRPKSDLI